MLRITAMLLAIPTALLFHGVSAYGHNCGHHGGCASSYSRDHACHGCDSWNNGSRWSAGNESQPRSGAAKVQTHGGKIAEVVYLPGATPERAMVEVRLAETDGVLVRLGPAGFLNQNGVTLREGDSITVSGYRVSSGTDDLVVATEISKDGRTLRLRDARGRSAW